MIDTIKTGISLRCSDLARAREIMNALTIIVSSPIACQLFVPIYEALRRNVPSAYSSMKALAH